MLKFHQIVATTFGLGYIPLAPGTWGAIFALLISYYLITGNVWILTVSILIGFLMGSWSSTVIEKSSGKTDPSFIVIDEVVGMWISLIAVPLNWSYYFAAFLLFRLFDIWKPFPINRLQAVKDGWGVMLDDVLAGLYSLVLIQIIIQLKLF